MDSGRLDDSLSGAARRREWIFLPALIGLFTYFLTLVYHRLSVGHFGDFPTFYWAARAMLRGDDPFFPYEANLSYVYPPLLAVLYTPLTHLSKLHAAQVILPINIAMALIALLLGVRAMIDRLDARLQRAGWFAMCFLAAALSENELRNQLQSLETDVLMLLCFTLALLWLDRRPLLAGIVLGFALNIKYLSIVTLPYLLIRRRWKSAAGVLLGSVTFALLPALVIGWSRNTWCLKIALGGLLRWVGIKPAGLEEVHVHNVADALSISVTSSCARLMDSLGRSDAAAFALAGSIGLACMLLLALIYRWKGVPFLLWPGAREQAERQPYRGLVAIEWACLIGLMLAFSPDTNPRHLVMALLLNACASVILLAPRPEVRRWPLMAGAAAMCVCFILPPKKYFSEEFCHRYFQAGVQSWGLLAMILTLVWVGVSYVRAAEAGSDK